MPGRVNNATFSRSATWLCSAFSHQCIGTNSGSTTVTSSPGSCRSPGWAGHAGAVATLRTRLPQDHHRRSFSSRRWRRVSSPVVRVSASVARRPRRQRSSSAVPALGSSRPPVRSKPYRSRPARQALRLRWRRTWPGRSRSIVPSVRLGRAPVTARATAETGRPLRRRARGRCRPWRVPPLARRAQPCRPSCASCQALLGRAVARTNCLRCQTTAHRPLPRRRRRMACSRSGFPTSTASRRRAWPSSSASTPTSRSRPRRRPTNPARGPAPHNRPSRVADPQGLWNTGLIGAWRSLVARTVRVGEVPGSNPGAPIKAPQKSGVFSFSSSDTTCFGRFGGRPAPAGASRPEEETPGKCRVSHRRVKRPRQGRSALVRRPARLACRYLQSRLVQLAWRQPGCWRSSLGKPRRPSATDNIQAR